MAIKDFSAVRSISLFGLFQWVLLTSLRKHIYAGHQEGRDGDVHLPPKPVLFRAQRF
jgi:hypothetical protein